MKKVTMELHFEDAQLRFTNFSGKPTKFNPAGGKRDFNIVLSKDQADEYSSEGWNIRVVDPYEEGDEPTYMLNVKVSYNPKARPPKVVLITSRKKTQIGEDEIGMLDFADIVKCDVIVTPYNWNVMGDEGVSAYLKALYVTIAEDEFEDKYADLPYGD